jgi:hypothetical protein
MRRLSLFCLTSFFVSTADAQEDVVRLRSGKYVSGTIVIDKSDREGFTLLRWDVEGKVYVRWSQIPESERNRLLHKSGSSLSAQELDGVVAVTPYGEFTGLPAGEEPTRLYIKTRDSRRPVAVPKADLIALRRRPVPPEEAYGPDERLDLGAAAEAARDYWTLRKLGDKAAELRLPHRSAEYYLQAGEADPTRRTEMEALAEACRARLREAAARHLFEYVQEQADRCEFALAIAGARRLAEQYPGTEAAHTPSNLIDRLRAEQEDFEAKREDFLAKRVPGAFRAERMNLIRRYATSNSLAAAERAATTFDARVCNLLADLLKSSPQQIRAAWNLRPREVRFIRRAILSKGQEAWETAGDEERREWLEVEYSAASSCISRVVDEVSCPACRTLRENCIRCRGTGKELQVHYW